MADFDLVVLGSGSAARDAARKASEDHGARVALVESVRWGGSCPNVACKPTKAYLVAADLLRDLRELGPALGLPVPGTIDLALVRAWKDTLRKTQERWREELDERYHTVQGPGAFAGRRTIRAHGAEVVADRVLVATGSRTAVPPIPGLEAVEWLDHVSALELDRLPSSLLVLGGGPVGLEFAQIFARFGAHVTVIQGAKRISPRSDAEATAELEQALRADGIDLITDVTVERFDSGAAVLSNGTTRRPERVLLASGRVPNVEQLGLEAIGVETHRGGIVVDDRLRTNVDGIWAAGDVTGLAQFTPVAQYQARIAVDDMFGSEARVADYSLLPTSIFTDPELGAVGLTEEGARAAGHDVGTATHPIGHVTRSQYVGERHGLFKLVYERADRRVLGVHVVSRNASDVVQGLALALARGVTVDELAAAHHVYPSWGEGVKAAAERALQAA